MTRRSVLAFLIAGAAVGQEVIAEKLARKAEREKWLELLKTPAGRANPELDGALNQKPKEPTEDQSDPVAMHVARTKSILSETVTPARKKGNGS